jgi:hypothetical protein
VARNNPPPNSSPAEIPQALAFRRNSEAWTVLEFVAVISYSGQM